MTTYPARLPGEPSSRHLRWAIPRRMQTACRTVVLSLCLGILSLGWMHGQARGEDGPGQESLDKATLVKLTAKSMADLESVVEMCEEALAKGLDEGNKAYAENLLSSTLYDQAFRMNRLIFEQATVDPRGPSIRQEALSKLQRAI